jgi:hypothetical protein
MKVDFYGGAITTVLAEKCIDVSDFRLVPDNQECWTEDIPSTPIALICEILEYKSNLTAQDSGPFFFEDLATLNGAQSPDRREVFSTSVTTAGTTSPQLPPEVEISLICGEQIVDRRRDGAVTEKVRMWVANIRLPQKETDILITVTLPYEKDPSTQVVKNLTEANGAKAEAFFQTVLREFNILNWGLFG